jgi:hypothetical protein
VIRIVRQSVFVPMTIPHSDEVPTEDEADSLATQRGFPRSALAEYEPGSQLVVDNVHHAKVHAIWMNPKMTCRFLAGGSFVDLRAAVPAMGIDVCVT